jgi:uncharacterized membrane protein
VSTTDAVLSSTARTPDCDGPRRFWLIPVVVLGTLIAAAVVFWTLVVVRILPTPPFAGPYPPLWFIFPIGFLLFWLLVILLIARRGGWVGRWGWGWESRLDAEEVVRIRYARGEISREEMSQRLHGLQESSRFRSEVDAR